MSIVNRTLRLVLPLLIGSFFAATAAEGETSLGDVPKPSVSVSFARPIIQENDSVQVDLWIANDSVYQLVDVKLHIGGPDFLEWHDNSCEGAAYQDPLSLGSIESHSALRKSLCVKTTSVIRVGEFNTLFTLEYGWNTNKGLATSVISYEKTIKSNILGSDNVAGVPLAFAGFVVPGLFFWFVVHLYKVPWNVGVALGDKLIYSVLVSICIVGIAKLIHVIDISNGISVDRLIQLALIGSLLGTLVGSVDWVVRLTRRRRIAEREIAIVEDERTLLRKLLKLNPNVKPSQTIVRLKNGEAYIGSLLAHTATKIALVGWFKIDLENQPPPFVKKMKALERDGKLADIFDAATRNGLEIQLDDAIQRQYGDEVENTGVGARQWDDDEISGITSETDSRLPLRLAQ